MISKRKINMLSLTILCIVSLLYSTLCFGANFPLEIINIKPAGTGNPAIPATHRIFRAYPGIDYNIRAAVIGGLYPYTFKLSNAPTGMTINSSTGEIDWPNPQANSGAITLSVTDSEGTTVTTSWSITVSTTGFYFVDSTKSVNGSGTISSPFSSLANMVAGTGASHLNDIVYFRGGNYNLVANGTSGDGTSSPEVELTDNAPFTWLGYPGETVNIIGNNVQIRTYRVYYDHLNFSSFSNHGIVGQGGFNYQAIRRCTFTNLTATSSLNVNQGFIYLNSASTPGYYFVIQDNELNNYTGGHAIGSIYDSYKMLIEDNYIHGNGGGGVTGINSAIGAKHNTWYLTVRHNKVIMNDTTNSVAFGYNLNSQMADTSHVEVCFNYFVAPKNSSRTVAHSFNGYGYGYTTPTFPSDVLVNGLYYRSLFDFYYYRNTLIGDISFSYIDGTNCSTAGPFTINNNVIINPNTSDTAAVPVGFNTNSSISYGSSTSPISTSPWKCVNDNNNLKALPTDNVVDSNGNLTASYQSYLGIAGWQTQANTSTISAPTGLKVVIK